MEYTIGSKIIASEIEVKGNDKVGEILLPDSAKHQKSMLSRLKEHPAQYKVVLAGPGAKEAGIKEGDKLYPRVGARMDIVVYKGSLHYVLNLSDILYGEKES